MKKESKRYSQVVWELMEQLLEVDDISSALSGSLEIIARATKSECGAVWILDEKSSRIYPICQIGSSDLLGFSIENGEGAEGIVVKTGETLCVEDVEKMSGYPGTIFEEFGVKVKTMLVAPIKAALKNQSGVAIQSMHECVGCIQLINKKDDYSYDEEDQQFLERMAALTAMLIADKGLPEVETGRKEVLISLQNVVKEFQNPGRLVRVLKGINLNIYKGELLVVVGESGCGKSTMVNIIGGMDSLTSGELLVEGKNYSHPTDQELTMFRRHYIGFIFQSYNLMPNLSAYDNIRFIAEISENPMPVQETLNLVGLGEKGGSFPAMMSGGQQQRVAIARALVKNPKLILADEPTAALDYETSIEVLSAIENISRTRGTTVIMITHNPEIGKMADRVIKLKGGRVFSIRTNRNPLHAEQLEW